MFMINSDASALTSGFYYQVLLYNLNLRAASRTINDVQHFLLCNPTEI